MVKARERLGDGLQLTRTQLEILFMLVENPQTTRDLARRLFLTQSAVTQTIDTLVRRNLIERHHDEQDRRIVRLHLSPSGRGLTERLGSMRRQHIEALLAKLTEGEVEVLISITEKLTQLINENAPALKGKS